MRQFGQILLFNAKTLEEKTTGPVVGFAPDSPNNTLMHYTALTHLEERALLHKGLFLPLHGNQRVQELILHQEALRLEETFA